MNFRFQVRLRSAYRSVVALRRMLMMLVSLAPRVLGMLRERVGAGLLAAYSVAVVLLTLAPLGVGYTIGVLVDAIVSAERVVHVELVTIVLLIVVATQAAVGRLQLFLSETIRDQLWFVVMQKSAYAIASLSPRFLSDPSNRALVTRVNEHGRWKVTQFTDSMTLLGLNLIGIVVAWALLWPLSAWLFAMVLVAMVEAVVELSASRADRQLTLRQSERWRSFWTLLWGTAYEENVPEHQLGGTSRRFASRLRGYGNVLYQRLYALRQTMLRMRFGVLLVTQCVLALAVWSVAHQAGVGAVSPGDLTFLIGGLVSFSGAVSRVAVNLHDLCRDGHVVGDVFTVLDASDTVQDEPPLPSKRVGVHPVGFGEPAGGEVSAMVAPPPRIALDDVHFSPDRRCVASERSWILRGISLDLEPGCKYVLVGASGSGKTTLTKLITRLEDPTVGAVQVDGHDLRAIDERNWRRRLGTLSQRFQKPEPFTVREILALQSARPLESIPEAEFRKAAERARLDEVLAGKRRGFDQLIGKEFAGGTELSEGEWQRLRLAAIFLRNAPVLILDEPTSGLDPATSSHVMQELMRRDGKTLLLVTHWLRHCPLADRILVMQKGLIAEAGTHDELMALGGEYARLYRQQLEEPLVRDCAA